MQHPVAERGDLTAGEFDHVGERDLLGPADEVDGGEDDLEPGSVLVEGPTWQVPQPGGLGLADAVLDPGMLAVPQLESGGLSRDEAGAGVGEDRSDPVTVDVAEGQLGAGVGPFLPSTVMWSAVVFEPAFPGCNRPPNASPAARSGRSRKHSNGWNPKVRFQVAAAFSFSGVRDGDGGVEVQTQLRAGRVQVGASAGCPRPFPCCGPGRVKPGEVVGIDPVKDPPRRGHRGHRTVQVCTVPEHADATDRVRAVSDRDREIGEHPPRGMNPRSPVGVGQRGRDCLGQAGVLGHLSQQTDPGMRHHIGTVSGDHDPRNLLATLHLTSARSPW